MSAEANKAIVQSYYEHLFNAHQYGHLDDFVTKNVEHHNRPLAPGVDSLRQFITTVSTAFPDSHVAIDFMVAEDDKVAVQLTFSGTHQGEFRPPGAGQGIPATGKTVNLPQIYIFRIDNGKIAEVWVGADDMGMMQQLGLIPA